MAALAATRDAPRAGTSKRNSVTILRTVTQPGTTIKQTVTAPAPPPVTTAASTPPPDTQTVANPTGTNLNAEGYRRMRVGDYQAALPLLERAVQQLAGTGTLDEAYADYNLAYTHYELGQCADVLTLLDRSQAIQGRRTEIDALRRDAHKGCA
jgi:hypothetical protein